MHHYARPLLVLILLAGLLASANSTGTLPVTASPAADKPPVAATPAAAQPPARIYAVQRGDTLGAIAVRFDVTTTELIEANGLNNPDNLTIGERLRIPGVGPLASADPAADAAAAGRGSLVARLPQPARDAAADSPFKGTTWVTYYGRPGVAVMGILGEFDLDGLIPLLRAQAHVYDEVNGPDLTVTPALHLIYGMATALEGANEDHLAYLDEDVVKAYIDRAAWEGMGVILDVQIGAVTPLTSIKPAFAYLKYRNVQLALDPEFAMTTEGQTIPGQPPGTITAGQINEVQAAIVDYMQGAQLPGHKMLIVHQFLPWMITDKDAIDELPGIDVAVCADGFGPPSPKVSKYNVFMAENVQFAGFKLFYRWDEPLMTESQAMGVDDYPNAGYMEITPSLIIYQ